MRRAKRTAEQAELAASRAVAMAENAASGAALTSKVVVGTRASRKAASKVAASSLAVAAMVAKVDAAVAETEAEALEAMPRSAFTCCDRVFYSPLAPRAPQLRRRADGRVIDDARTLTTAAENAAMQIWEEKRANASSGMLPTLAALPLSATYAPLVVYTDAPRAAATGGVQYAALVRHVSAGAPPPVDAPGQAAALVLAVPCTTSTSASTSTSTPAYAGRGGFSAALRCAGLRLLFETHAPSCENNAFFADAYLDMRVLGFAGDAALIMVAPKVCGRRGGVGGRPALQVLIYQNNKLCAAVDNVLCRSKFVAKKSTPWDLSVAAETKAYGCHVWRLAGAYEYRTRRFSGMRVARAVAHTAALASEAVSAAADVAAAREPADLPLPGLDDFPHSLPSVTDDDATMAVFDFMADDEDTDNMAILAMCGPEWGSEGLAGRPEPLCAMCGLAKSAGMLCLCD